MYKTVIFSAAKTIAELNIGKVEIENALDKRVIKIETHEIQYV